jgi:isoquinoline 1-oxidoreductase beta subunit
MPNFGESVVAAETLGAPETKSEIRRLSEEAYARYDQEAGAVRVLDRRSFVGTVFSASAFLLGASVATTNAEAAIPSSANTTPKWQPSVYLGFDSDGTVVIVAHRSEMGTGSRTSLPMVVADELGADWTKVRVEQALGNEKYGSQNTDGSCSVRDFVLAMREAGATARTMLERAAAKKWNCSPGDVAVLDGKVVHGASKKTLAFGELVGAMGEVEVPKKHELRFKTPEQYKLKTVPILDQKDLLVGKGTFGLDARRPGMLYAVIERPPVYGSTVKNVDTSAAMQVKGVVQTAQLPLFKQPHLFQQLGGVAVLADSTWAAMQGRKKLKVDWDLSEHKDYSSSREKQFLLEQVHKPGKVVRNRGYFDDAFAGAAQKFEADYYAPMLSHAPMEPPVAVAEWKDGKVETWCPTQNPQAVQDAVAAAMGIKKEDVICHVTLLGGGFGRKSKPDYVVEAALLAKQTGKPVKVVWTREDDIKFDYYHSVSAMHLKAGLRKDGSMESLLFRSAFPPIASTFAPGMQYGADFETGMCLNEISFDVPNIRAENCPAPNHVRFGWMRAVTHVFHAFGLHSFIDELAHLQNTDYVTYFLKNLGNDRKVDLAADGVKPWNNGQSIEKFPIDTGRLRRVLEMAAEQSGYAKKKSVKGHGYGIAAHRSFLSYIASVVEVEVDDTGKVTIPNVWTVADCGQTVYPDRVKAQFEGAAVFGTSIAMMGEITANNGRIVQSNFNDYPVARLTEAPRNVHVHIVDSKDPHAGVGEPGVPVIPPAITAAIFNATGKRVRELPAKRTKLV